MSTLTFDFKNLKIEHENNLNPMNELVKNKS